MRAGGLCASKYDPAVFLNRSAHEQAVIALLAFTAALQGSLAHLREFFRRCGADDDDAAAATTTGGCGGGAKAEAADGGGSAKPAASGGGAYGAAVASEIARIAADVEADLAAASAALGALDAAIVRTVCTKLVATVVTETQHRALKKMIASGLLTSKEGAKFEERIITDVKDRRRHTEDSLLHRLRRLSKKPGAANGTTVQVAPEPAALQVQPERGAAAVASQQGDSGGGSGGAFESVVVAAPATPSSIGVSSG